MRSSAEVLGIYASSFSDDLRPARLAWGAASAGESAAGVGDDATEAGTSVALAVSLTATSVTLYG
ncbi:hypothetical protein [Timonella senegalensis]|uniref:hypothetical protein n=1 Tax=Timonella senegalensis TaxID=1465825 RepID=UPI002FDD902C